MLFVFEIIHSSIPVNFRRSEGAAPPFPTLVRSLGDQLVDLDIIWLPRLHVASIASGCAMTVSFNPRALFKNHIISIFAGLRRDITRPGFPTLLAYMRL